MTTLATSNKRKARARKRSVYLAAKAEHEARVSRLYVSGRTDKLKRSGYVLRQMRREKARRRHYPPVVYALHEDTPLRVWTRAPLDSGSW